jgi:NADPH-dependent ferric siderophore reductase
MGLLNSLVSKAFHRALLIHKEKIARNTFHLRMKLSGDSFRNYVPGQHIRILTESNNSAAINLRTYSIWNINKEKQEVDLAVCTFSNGPGSQWIKQINVGDTVYFGGPMGKLTIDLTADNYLFLGDISALAHLYKLRRQLNPGQDSIGITYADDEGDFFADIFSDTRFDFVRSLNDHVQIIKKALNYLVSPKMNTIAYIAGEASFCVELNAYLRKELNWDTKQIKTKPFWHPEKKGMD